MRPFSPPTVALAALLLGQSSLALPAPEEKQTFVVYPLEVVVAAPTKVELACAENKVYTIANDVEYTVTNAPTSIVTEVVRYSTIKSYHTVAQCDDPPVVHPPASWNEGECLPPGNNIVIPPEGDRKIPLTITIPTSDGNICGIGSSNSPPETASAIPTTTVKVEDWDTAIIIPTSNPSPPDVTRTQPGNPTTFTIPGTRPGEPDTVIIQTPTISTEVPQSPITTTEPGNPTTFTVPGTRPGDSDIVIIRTPLSTATLLDSSTISSSDIGILPSSSEASSTQALSSTNELSTKGLSSLSQVSSSEALSSTEESSSTIPTFTPTPTPTIPPQVDDNCDNTGFKYAIFKHNQTNNDPEYSNLDIEPFRSGNPVFIGKTERFGFPGQTSNIIQPAKPYPDAPEQFLNFTAINHEAYMFSAIPGEYTIRIGYSDDIVLFWLGEKAYSGYERDNANATRIYPQEEYEVKINLDQGQYLPLRVLWVNAQGAYRFDIEIEDPEGNIIADKNSLDPAYFVTSTCDNRDQTPDFPAFAPIREEQA